MKQFDVCRVSGPGVGKGERLVVVLQHHDFAEVGNLIVAPLYLASELPAIEQLRPPVIFKRLDYIVAVDRLASIPKRQIGKALGNLEASRYDLSKAVDLIISGF